MTTYTLRPAGSDNLTPADYRDIFTELRAARSLRRLVEAAGAAEGRIAYWSRYERNNQTAIGIDAPLGTVTAGGIHHALVMSYYSNNVPQGVDHALPTVTTVDRHSLAISPEPPALDDCLFRMLTAGERKLAQSFPRDYVILGNQRDQVRQIGNANPPVLMDALLERVAPIVQ